MAHVFAGYGDALANDLVRGYEKSGGSGHRGYSSGFRVQGSEFGVQGKKPCHGWHRLTRRKEKFYNLLFM
jgi:hypothetical protein